MTINVDPTIGSLGPLSFHWYGLIMAIAVLVGVVVFSFQLRKRSIDPTHAWGVAVLAVPCGVIGARLFHVAENFDYYWEHPGKIFGGQLVGLAIYGVITGGLLGLVVYCRWRKLPVWRVLDSTALAFPVGQVIGKFANIINGDTWGNPTSLPWGLTYTNPHAFIPDALLGVPTQPNPIYEQLWLLVIVGVLVFALPRLKTDGLAFLLYVGLYSGGRFFLSYLRVNKIIVLGLREAQIAALVGIVLAVSLALFLWLRARRAGSLKLVDNAAACAGTGADTAESDTGGGREYSE